MRIYTTSKPYWLCSSCISLGSELSYMYVPRPPVAYTCLVPTTCYTQAQCLAPQPPEVYYQPPPQACAYQPPPVSYLYQPPPVAYQYVPPPQVYYTQSPAYRVQ
ncbi:MAG TPA: hypothetical protein VE862_04180 [Candidatus Acidoferrum sp.]|nr:hypothetical protein [Candidatus Acidoferrum sp.]